jgi:glycosyltransferase involved in cell wall biosynthesis
MLFKLLKGMDNQLFENKVISLIPTGYVGEQIAALGVDVQTLGLKRNKISLTGLIKLVKMIKKWNPVIIQTWLYHADLLGYFVAKLTGVKNLIWNVRCSNMDFNKYNRLTTWTVKACAFFSNFPVSILTNSNIAKDFHVTTLGYKKNKFQIIPNGFDISIYKHDSQAGMRIRKELGISKNSICVGLIGRYDPMKDHKSFLKAAQIINQDFHNIIYILAGKDITKENEKLVTIIKEM